MSGDEGEELDLARDRSSSDDRRSSNSLAGGMKTVDKRVRKIEGHEIWSFESLASDRGVNGGLHPDGRRWECERRRGGGMESRCWALMELL